MGSRPRAGWAAVDFQSQEVGIQERGTGFEKQIKKCNQPSSQAAKQAPGVVGSVRLFSSLSLWWSAEKAKVGMSWSWGRVWERQQDCGL